VHALPVELYDAIEITSRGMSPRRLQEQNQTSNATGGNETNQTSGGGAGTTSNETNQTSGGVNETNQTTGGNATVPGVAGFNATAFAAAYMVNNETDSSCSSQCCQCVANQTQQMLVNASQVLNASCADQGNNRGTNVVCDFLRTQQNITIGMVMGFANVNELATAYCVGEGSCPAPVISSSDACPNRAAQMANASDINAASTIFATGNALQRGVGSSYLTCLLNTAFTIMDRRVAVNKNYCSMVLGSSSGQTDSGNQTTNQTGMRALRNFRTKFQDQSSNQTNQTSTSPSGTSDVCEYDKRVCEYEQQNPDVAWGILYSDLQPLKYARGFCAGLLIEP